MLKKVQTRNFFVIYPTVQKKRHLIDDLTANMGCSWSVITTQNIQICKGIVKPNAGKSIRWAASEDGFWNVIIHRIMKGLEIVFE